MHLYGDTQITSLVLLLLSKVVLVLVLVVQWLVGLMIKCSYFGHMFAGGIFSLTLAMTCFLNQIPN